MEQNFKMKILITEPLDFAKENLLLLRKMAEVKIGPFSREELLMAVIDADVIMLRLNHYIDQEILQKAKKLKFILTPTTGLNHIDVTMAEGRKIEIISLKGETEFLSQIPSTAEHTWALLLSLLRKIPQGYEHVKQGNWNRDQFKSHNLCHYTLGVLGFGRVGKQISEYAKVFDMPFLFYDTDSKLQEHTQAINSLEVFLGKIDILSIHIPLNKKNLKFLSASNLKHLKSDAYIINTSRGEIIDEKFIALALTSKKIGGYATDVLSYENNSKKRKENPLLSIVDYVDNLIITPHIAGATYESMQKTEKFVIKKFLKKIGK